MCDDPELSNKDLYPTFARTYPVSKQVLPLLVALLKMFKWHIVALIYDNNFEQTKEYFKQRFSEKNINVSYEASVPSNFRYQPDVWDQKFPELLKKIKENARGKCYLI